MTDPRIDEIRDRWKDGVPRWAKPDVDCLLSIIDEQKARIEELEREKMGRERWGADEQG